MRPAYTTRGEGTVLQEMRSDDANDIESSFLLQSLCSSVFQKGYLVYGTSHSHVHFLNVFSPHQSYSLSLSTYPVLSSRDLTEAAVYQALAIPDPCYPPYMRSLI